MYEHEVYLKHIRIQLTVITRHVEEHIGRKQTEKMCMKNNRRKSECMNFVYMYIQYACKFNLLTPLKKLIIIRTQVANKQQY